MNAYFSIGMMSGTSLDGIDLCYVRFWEENATLQFQIIVAKTYHYSQYWKETLQKAFYFSEENLQKLDVDFGKLIADYINLFIQEFSIQKIDFIASHGQTIHHQPEKGYTLQIGNGQTIANITQQIVVNDFRTQDVLLGGQGAPLVPIGDQMLFANYDACLNIGGFANISFQHKGKRIAFDICAANIVLNHFAHQLGFPFDKEGIIARHNRINIEILSHLNSLYYYHQKPPKSLGLEWVNENIFPVFSTKNWEENIATYTVHIATQIHGIAQQYKFKNILLTGGGAYNIFLVEELQKQKNTNYIVPNATTIEYKEALIFALLGYLRINGQHNVLSSVTGASRNHSSGKIWKP